MDGEKKRKGATAMNYTDLENRARKIFALFQLPMDYDENNGIPKGLYDSVLAELRAVVEEAYDARQEFFNCKKAHFKSEVEGYRRGLDEAAEIAEFHSGPSIQLAEKIRARAEEVK